MRRAIVACLAAAALAVIDGRFPPGADLDAAWDEGIRAFGAAAPHRR